VDKINDASLLISTPIKTKTARVSVSRTSNINFGIINLKQVLYLRILFMNFLSATYNMKALTTPVKYVPIRENIIALIILIFILLNLFINIINKLINSRINKRKTIFLIQILFFIKSLLVL
jgi:hypothetical protein